MPYTRKTDGEVLNASDINSMQVGIEASETHIARTDNPHAVTKAQVGLSNVDNTSDLEKPVSTATQLALDLKSDATHNHMTSDALIIGTATTPTGDIAASVVLGHGNNPVDAHRSVIVGSYTTNASTVIGNNAVAIGHWQLATGNESVSIGAIAQASGSQSVAVGRSARATQQYTVALGRNAQATATGGATALGTSSLASGSGSTALGYGAEATATNAITIGNVISNTTANRCVIKTNQLHLTRSDGQANFTSLILSNPSGSGRELYIDNDNTLVINGFKEALMKGEHRIERHLYNWDNYATTTNVGTLVDYNSYTFTLLPGTWYFTLDLTASLSRSVTTGGMQLGWWIKNAAGAVVANTSRILDTADSVNVNVPNFMRIVNGATITNSTTANQTWSFGIQYCGTSTAGTTGIRHGSLMVLSWNAS